MRTEAEWTTHSVMQAGGGGLPNCEDSVSVFLNPLGLWLLPGDLA